MNVEPIVYTKPLYAPAPMKAGVRPLPEGKVRNHSISFVVNDDEHKAMQAAVEASSESRSALIRAALRRGGLI